MNKSFYEEGKYKDATTLVLIAKNFVEKRNTSTKKALTYVGAFVSLEKVMLN